MCFLYSLEFLAVYIVKKLMGFFAVYMVEETFVCVTIDTGAHSILLQNYFTLHGDFAQIFKQRTLKIPSKLGRKKRKGFALHARFLDQMTKVFLIVI